MALLFLLFSSAVVVSAPIAVSLLVLVLVFFLVYLVFISN